MTHVILPEDKIAAARHEMEKTIRLAGWKLTDGDVNKWNTFVCCHPRNMVGEVILVAYLLYEIGNGDPSVYIDLEVVQVISLEFCGLHGDSLHVNTIVPTRGARSGDAVWLIDYNCFQFTEGGGRETTPSIVAYERLLGALLRACAAVARARR